jgi:MoaA/NifB/PqqE/SkfB family radical SAM enzyme
VWGICSPTQAKISRRNLQYPAALRRGFFISQDGKELLIQSFSRLNKIKERFMDKKFMVSVVSPIKSLYRRILPENVRIKIGKINYKIFGKKSKRKFLRFDVHLTDHCNLNCKGCEHFSPLADEKFTDTAVFERDCKHLSKLSDGCIEDITILGGEPLLHPKLIDFIETARKYFPETIIEINTNGILLQNLPETVWKDFKKNRIKLIISVYPVTLNYDSINLMAKKYGIEIYYRGETIGNVQMYKYWQKMPIDIRGEQDSRKSFGMCYAANHCFQLVDGKLYPCFRIAYIHYFNKFFETCIQVTKEDYIDIYKAKNADEILDFLRKPSPFCRYCNMKGKIANIEWGISKKHITEWI